MMMRGLGSVGLAAVLTVSLVGVGFAQRPGEPKPPASYDAVGEMRYNADGENNHIWMLMRESGTILGTFGRNGRSAGQFHWVHNLAVDSKGNIYTTEVDTGKRAQRFVYRGR